MIEQLECLHSPPPSRFSIASARLLVHRSLSFYWPVSAAFNPTSIAYSISDARACQQRLCVSLLRPSWVSHLSVYSILGTFLNDYEPRCVLALCTGRPTGLHRQLEARSVLFNEPRLRRLLDFSGNTSRGTTTSTHHFCSSVVQVVTPSSHFDQSIPGPKSTTFCRPGAGAIID